MGSLLTEEIRTLLYDPNSEHSVTVAKGLALESDWLGLVGGD